jgi:hypothetical protein
VGGAIYDTAYLSGGVSPTGTITFRLYGSGATDCSGRPIFTATVNVTGNGPHASPSFVPPGPGAYRWVVKYSGDRTNRHAGPTRCGDKTELGIVRPPVVTPVVPTFSTTATQSPAGGATLSDIAHLADGLEPGGSLVFSLYGPDDQTCAGPPAFTSVVEVLGNGDYRSAEFTVPRPGTYRWVVSYSGDALNAAAGPTACGESTETSAVSDPPATKPNPGPNVLPATRSRLPRRPKPPPRVTG